MENTKITQQANDITKLLHPRSNRRRRRNQPAHGS